MLFSLKPKENRRELFGRESELEELKRLTKTEWVIILGRKMTGKTSLLKVFLKEMNGIYVNLSGIKSIEGLVTELTKNIIRTEAGIDLKILKLSFTKLAEDVFSRLEGRIVGLDEAQNLPSNYFLKLLKKIWDTYDIRFIFTGSAMGLYKKLLDPKYASPMFGRIPAKLELKPFTTITSIEFLKRGFSECKMSISEQEINETVETLNGYVGWLTYYGNLRCVRKIPHLEALRETSEQGIQATLEEIKAFLRSRKNDELYIKILKYLPAKWSELLKITKVNSKVLNDALETLQETFLVRKINRTYTTTDNLIKRAIIQL